MPGKKDFFDKEEDEEESSEEEKDGGEETPQTVTVGGKEYSEEDLERLVGLGQIGAEAEEKFDTKIESIWPDYTKKSQHLKEVEKELEELKSKAKQQEDQAQPGKLTDEQKALARQQLEDLMGGRVLTQAEFDNLYAQRRAGERLLDDTQDLIAENEEAGKPKVAVEKLLKFMQEEDYRSPQRAYDAMFEKELAQWKEKQTQTLKTEGLVTQEASTAGKTKTPPEKKLKSREELEKALAEHFRQQAK